jgi:hypothetical protein
MRRRLLVLVVAVGKAPVGRRRARSPRAGDPLGKPFRPPRRPGGIVAFALRGRDVARALNAGRFIENAFNVGQTISLGELKGQIVPSSDVTIHAQRERTDSERCAGSLVTRMHRGPLPGTKEAKCLRRREEARWLSATTHSESSSR